MVVSSVVTGPIASVVPIKHNKDTVESSGEAKHSCSNAVISFKTQGFAKKMWNSAFLGSIFLLTSLCKNQPLVVVFLNCNLKRDGRLSFMS